MNWFLRTFVYSVGKKLLMAITGLAFCLFLVGHLAGNLTIYGGRAAFNAYADHLHALGVLVTLAEIGLLVMAVIHVATGLILFIQNWSARPERYEVHKSGGGRTIGSRTMPYTGILLLVFIIFHLINFHFVDKTGTTIFEIVTNAFASPVYVILYVAAMIVVALHVSHGLWSAFQTLGIDHPKYSPAIRGISVIFSLVVGFGFGLIPIYLLTVAAA